MAVILPVVADLLASALAWVLVPWFGLSLQTRNTGAALVLAAATLLGVEVITQEVSTESEINRAIATVPEDVQAIFLAQDSLVAAHIAEFAAAAIAHQLPLCSPTDGQVEQGALVSYSFRLNEIGQQAARLADQIFSGIPPANLPVETAEFFLTVNLKTATAINLTLSDDLLRTADRVIRE